MCKQMGDGAPLCDITLLNRYTIQGVTPILCNNTNIGLKNEVTYEEGTNQITEFLLISWTLGKTQLFLYKFA